MFLVKKFIDSFYFFSFLMECFGTFNQKADDLVEKLKINTYEQKCANLDQMISDFALDVISTVIKFKKTKFKFYLFVSLRYL